MFNVSKRHDLTTAYRKHLFVSSSAFERFDQAIVAVVVVAVRCEDLIDKLLLCARNTFDTDDANIFHGGNSKLPFRCGCCDAPFRVPLLRTLAQACR